MSAAMEVALGKLRMRNPVMTASGTGTSNASSSLARVAKALVSAVAAAGSGGALSGSAFWYVGAVL